MRCRNCGEEMPDRALVCGKCGTPVAEEEQPKPENDFREVKEEPRRSYDTPRREPARQAAEPAPSNGREGLAQAGMLTGIFACVLLMVPMAAIPVSVAGILMGALGCRSRYQTRAVAAIVMGVIVLLTAMVLVMVQSMLAPYQDELVQLIYSQMR